MNVELGFSTGALHEHCSTKEAIKLIKDVGCTSIELGFVVSERIEQGQLGEITADDIADFDWVSLHAPKIRYGNNEETREVFQKIERLNSQRRLDLVVIHPDVVLDFSVFDDVEFSIGFENMDSNKLSHKGPNELKNIVDKNKNWKIVLDVNHVYTNDKSMNLASLFYDILGDRVAEIHLSGFSTSHDPLYQTQQLEIIKSIQDFQIPIIVESVLPPEALTLEKNYILEAIKNYT